MTASEAQTPDDYIASLPPDRRAAAAQVVQVVRDNLPAGFEEGMLYGMIGWYVPLERFPDTEVPLGGLAQRPVTRRRRQGVTPRVTALSSP